MKISVIIPVYNVEKYLKQCVDSVLSQSYENIEVVLVDDGSPDACPKICDEYKKTDDRIVVIHQKNGGLSAARNAGISVMTGDYVIFLDSDDFWDDKEALNKLIQRVKISEADVLCFSFKKYYEETGIEKQQFENKDSMPLTIKNRLERMDYVTRRFLYCASAWNKLICSELLKSDMTFKVGIFSEDIEWSARLLAKAKSIDFINESFYCYRQRSTSITHNIKDKAFFDLKDSIIGCVEVAKNSDKEIQKYIYRYSAYQFSTFIAVQARFPNCPIECYTELKRYSWVLKYHCKNIKIRCLYWVNKIVGLKMLCKLICVTLRIWD